MLFGEFLMEKGLVNDADLISALDQQQQSKMPLGQMAIEKGYMDSRALFKVLTAQRKKNRDKNDFGSLALEMGVLNQQQVNELIGLQNASRELLGDILVEKGILPPDKLVQILREYNLKNR
jgi:hypothetical protein